MKLRTRRTAAIAWLPVLCLVALALSTAPGSSEERRVGNLEFSPKEFYGGQSIKFSGSIGSSGRHKIWLEFNMGRTGDDWTFVEGSVHYTDGSGKFSFDFPARAMKNIALRVASASSVTNAVLFEAHDQVAALHMKPAGLDYDGGRCAGSRLENIRYDAIAGETLTLTVDSSPDSTEAKEPILTGRNVTLQRRDDDNRWVKVSEGKLNDAGRASFDLPVGTSRIAYRVRLEDWTKNSDQVGWFPSFPTYVDPKERPDSVATLEAQDPTADPWADPKNLLVEWSTVTDPAVENIIVAWKQGSQAPTSPDDPEAEVESRGPGATQLAVGQLQPESNYSFAVFTRSDQGICSHAATDAEQTDAVPEPAAITGFTSVASTSNRVDLSWDPISSAPPAGQGLTGIYIYRDGQLIDTISPTATSYSDTSVWPNDTFSYEVYTINEWDHESPHAYTSVTTPEQTP